MVDFDFYSYDQKRVVRYSVYAAQIGVGLFLIIFILMLLSNVIATFSSFHGLFVLTTTIACFTIVPLVVYLKVALDYEKECEHEVLSERLKIN